MEQNNRPIKVEFPSKMRVNSPEIDSINKTTNRISNWLHNDLKAIIEPLTVVRFIPDMITDFKKTVVTQFTNLLMGQIEGDVINRQANIKVLNKKIESTKNHINQKEKNLDKTNIRVTNRYTNLAEQLNTEHEIFLRKLDSHAYEIIDKVYPNQIQDKFSYDSLPSIDFLSEHAMVSVTDRNICLDQGMNDAYKEVSRFVDNRQLFYNDLNEFECNGFEEGVYELPFCFMELENSKTGQVKKEYWFQSELIAGEKNPDFDGLRLEMEIQADDITTSEKQIDSVLQNIEDFLNEKILDSEKQRFIDDLK